MRKNWLILSHAFNMDGRAASHTITDKISHLLKAGIKPIVISAPTGGRDAHVPHFQVPAVAPSGLRFDLRHSLRMRFGRSWKYRISSLLMNLLLIPPLVLERLFIHLESQWSWYVLAYYKGARLIRDGKVDLLYSTGGANSAHYAGYLLAKRFGIPWMAEIHDPMIHDNWTRSRMAYAWARHLEKLICRHADIAIWFTEKVLERARERNPQLGDRGHAIIPGAERPDFGDAVYKHREIMSIGHFGSLSRTRNLQVFLQGLQAFLDLHPEARKAVRFEVYGADPDDVSRAALETFPYPDNVLLHGRLEFDPATGLSGRDRVLRHMRTSDCLLLLHGKEPFCEEYIPSKLYEYAWARRPILALTWNNPQLDGLLERAGHSVINAGDAAGVARSLEGLFAHWLDGSLADMPETFSFPVERAVNEMIDLVGKLDGNR
ncbi:MAG TPA: glycosyltransferase [Burkholderiales bacterium]